MMRDEDTGAVVLLRTGGIDLIGGMSAFGEADMGIYQIGLNSIPL
jgi:hypothetical protein